MRRNDPTPLVLPLAVHHPHAAEMEAISEVLLEQPTLAALVEQDLLREGASPQRGRPGMTGQQVLRAAILKPLRQFSYDALAFALIDSVTYRRFCRYPIDAKTPSSSTLQHNIVRITARTWRAINQALIRVARQRGIDRADKARIDATVVDTNIHKPDDAAQLWDTVRVLTRLLHRLNKLGHPVPFHRRTKRAKRRRMDILYAKKKDPRNRAYRDLLAVTEEVIGYADAGVVALTGVGEKKVVALVAELSRVAALGWAVVKQTRARVFEGRHLAACDKVFSLFEEHTDILVKGKRDVQFGHKVYFSVGASSLVFDVYVAAGNPADSSLTVELVSRTESVTGRLPRQVSLDGCFASRSNLAKLKGQGVRDVCFSKSQGIPLLEMVKSSWVFKQLYRFRAGVEGVISHLKRTFGLGRCLWRGREGFEKYVLASVVSCNLLTIARHLVT